MSCPLSAQMTVGKCGQLRGSYTACIGCEGFRRRLIVDLPGDVYDRFLKLFPEGVEEAVAQLCGMAAAGKLKIGKEVQRDLLRM